MPYQKFNAGDDLCQGDILEPGEALQPVLEEVHPHFLDSKYTFFLILTQSCDLVRRQDVCKSQYINLAVVRPLEDILLTLLDKSCEKLRLRTPSPRGFYTAKSKYQARALLKRILNQNEEAMGLFYLHPDTTAKIAEYSVALLQVGIALRAKEHYRTCLAARCGRLTPMFRDRLGWLVGNLYSRVATEDLPKEERDQIIALLLDRREDVDSTPYWVPDENATQARRKQLEVEGFPRREVFERLIACTPTPTVEIAAEQAIDAVEDVLGRLTPDQRVFLLSKLTTDPVFCSACK